MEDKKSADERAKEIIGRFKKLSLEQMEMVIIKLGIPTDRKIGKQQREQGVETKAPYLIIK